MRIPHGPATVMGAHGSHDATDREVGKAGAPFRFAPERGPAFFETFGWRPAEVHNSFYTAARIGRLTGFLRLMARIFPEPKTWKPKRVWGGVCRLERAASPGLDTA